MTGNPITKVIAKASSNYGKCKGPATPGDEGHMDSVSDACPVTLCTGEGDLGPTSCVMDSLPLDG